MNTNASTAAVIGIGAIGTILAYFGLQYVSEDEVSSEFESVEENVNNSDNLYNEVEKESTTQTTKKDETPEKLVTSPDPTQSNEVNNTTKNLVNEQGNTKINKNGIKLEVTEAITDQKTDKNKWSEYWEGEYKNQDKDKQEIVVEKF